MSLGLRKVRILMSFQNENFAIRICVQILQETLWSCGIASCECIWLLHEGGWIVQRILSGAPYIAVS